MFCMVLGIWKIFCLILMKKFKKLIRCVRSPIDTTIGGDILAIKAGNRSNNSLNAIALSLTQYI